MRLQNGDLEWKVDNETPPSRLDIYLKHKLPRYSREEIKQYIAEGAVKRKTFQGIFSSLKSSNIIHSGDILRLKRPKPSDLDTSSLPKEPIAKIYEDEYMLVVNKPAGMLVHPAGVRIDGTLIGVLNQDEANHNVNLQLTHRLDRETSGLVILGKTLDSTRKITLAFKQRLIKKSYLAVVKGKPSWINKEVSNNIGTASDIVRIRQKVIFCDTDCKKLLIPKESNSSEAKTYFEKIEEIGTNYALVSASPFSGRLHQIRVHLEYLNHPIVGDKIYGTDGAPFIEFTKEGLTPSLLERLIHWRHALHASFISFEHPVEKKIVSFSAPPPKDFMDLIEKLRYT